MASPPHRFGDLLDGGALGPLQHRDHPSLLAVRPAAGTAPRRNREQPRVRHDVRFRRFGDERGRPLVAQRVGECGGKGLSRIEREYEVSDQRRYFVPCPHCGEYQCLKFERLRWQRAPADAGGVKGSPETAAYLCEACEQPIAEPRE